MALNGTPADQILTYYYGGTAVTDYDYTNVNGGNIRVNVEGDVAFMYLRFEDDPSNTNAVAVAPSITIGGTPVAGVAMNVDYTFRLTGTSFELTGAGISTITGTSAQITWDNNSTLANVNGGPVGSNGSALLGTCSTSTCPHRYKYGTMDIFVSALKPGVVVTQDLQAVITLKTNTEYLYGIGEVPSSWHAEVLKAQAIASRTYASRKLQDSPNADRDDCGCHIFSSTVDQAYVGFSKQYLTDGNRWVDAVNATVDPNNANIGKVVTSSGNLIVAYYSASTGGKTQPLNEWASSSGASYLQSVVDTLSLDDRVNNPLRSWSVTVDRAVLTTRMQAQGVSISDIANVAITGTYASGGVSQLTLTNSSGGTTVVNVGPGQLVTPDELRTMFGAYSTYFTGITANGLTPTQDTSTPAPAAPAAPAPAAPAPAPAAPTSVAPANASASTKVRSITSVKWPSSKIRPGATSVTGRVSPAQAGVSVSFQVLRNGGWTTVGTDVTGRQGAWKVTWADVSAGTHKVRVVAASKVNTVATSARSLSAVGNVTLVGPTRVNRNTQVVLRGKVTPGVSGAPVQVQRKIGSGAWKTVGTVATDGSGNWSFAISAGSTKTTSRFRVIVADGRVGSITSKTLATSVR
jgi:SpoIID/LytB domain protein